jgi:hypothetical protein
MKMDFDVILPISLFAVVAVTILAYQKLEGKTRILLEEKRLGKYEVVLFVGTMGLMITLIAFMPVLSIQIIYLSCLTFLLFSFIYVIFKRWYLALFPPIVLILFYFFYWNIYIFNLFAIIFACIITIYLNTLFSWKTISIFAILITLLDVFQVFGTGFMGQAAIKILELKLPVLIVLPTYPIDGIMGLGLGDILLSGLLSMQMVLKRGQKVGILTALTISIALFFYEIISFNYTSFTYFPATIIVIMGWLSTIVITSSKTVSNLGKNLKTHKKELKESRLT